MRRLLFVPGLNCTAALFAPQIAALADIGEAHVADHGGHDSMGALAADIIARAPPTFALIGLSMGGYVAFEIMRQARGRVTHLALLDTRATVDGPEDRQRRLDMIALAENGGFGTLHGLAWPRLVHPSRLDDHELEAEVRGMATATGPQRYVRQQRALLGRPNYADELAAITVPALVIVGEQDLITPPADALTMAKDIPGAHLLVLPGCGHLSTLEKPAETSEALRELLMA
ncbi:MAG: alpha/beta fold hydrolase [Beijerinckiaceae bacterium]